MKPKIHTSKLFRKYFFTFIIILLSSFTFLGSALLVFSTQYWTNDRQVALSLHTRQAAREISAVYAGWGDIDARQRALRAVLRAHTETMGTETQFFLFDTEGRVVACPEAVHETFLPLPVQCEIHSAWRLRGATVAQALVSSDTHGRFTQIGNLDGLFGENMIIAADPFVIDGVRAGVVLAAQPFSEYLIIYLSRILQLFFLSSLVVMMLAFVAAYYITRRLVHPLNAMVSATKLYAKGDFRYRVNTPENDELRLLAEAFNSMAVSLATLEASRRSFVANVSHELKTPMTSIGGFIDGMLDGTIAPEEHGKYLQLVSGEVQRLSRLVTGMLNLSKIEAGELEMKRVSFDISELLFTTLLSFERIIAARQIELVGLDELGSQAVAGDKDLLTQVFYNLIDNAVKFTPPGGQIELRVTQERDRSRIALRNTGVGISPEELARIFERFYKTDQSRSYDTKGAGLGLYLAKTIVAMHGGGISVDSDGARWVEFVVELPD